MSRRQQELLQTEQDIVEADGRLFEALGVRDGIPDPPHTYKALVELTFEHGRLIDAKDHSEAMVPYRVTLSEWAKLPRRAWYLRWLRPRPIDAQPPMPVAHHYSW